MRPPLIRPTSVDDTRWTLRPLGPRHPDPRSLPPSPRVRINGAFATV